MSTTNGPKSTKSGCSLIHLYIPKSATFTLTFKVFLTEEAFHTKIPVYATEEQK